MTLNYWYSELSCLTLSIKGTVWRTSGEVYLLCRWERHLAAVFPVDQIGKLVCCAGYIRRRNYRNFCASWRRNCEICINNFCASWRRNCEICANWRRISLLLLLGAKIFNRQKCVFNYSHAARGAQIIGQSRQCGFAVYAYVTIP